MTTKELMDTTKMLNAIKIDLTQNEFERSAINAAMELIYIIAQREI